MRLLRFIHEQITNPTTVENDTEESKKEQTGEHELKKEEPETVLHSVAANTSR